MKFLICDFWGLVEENNELQRQVAKLKFEREAALLDMQQQKHLYEMEKIQKQAALLNMKHYYEMELLKRELKIEKLERNQGGKMFESDAQ